MRIVPKVDLSDYPIGPILGSVFYTEGCEKSARDTNWEEVDQIVTENAPYAQIDSANDFAALLEELADSKLPLSLERFCESFPHYFDAQDFAMVLQRGAAAMMRRDFAAALIWIQSAHRLAPEEAAPLINLAEIYLAEGQNVEAREWAHAALQRVPNELRCWRVLAESGMSESELMDEAERRGSWIGISLTQSISEEPDLNRKVTALSQVYAAGERDGGFLVEYTASLGQTLQYEKIPPIALGVSDNWRVIAHALQALKAMGKYEEESEIFWKKADRIQDSAGKTFLRQLRLDLAEEDQDVSH